MFFVYTKVIRFVTLHDSHYFGTRRQLLTAVHREKHFYPEDSPEAKLPVTLLSVFLVGRVSPSRKADSRSHSRVHSAGLVTTRRHAHNLCGLKRRHVVSKFFFHPSESLLYLIVIKKIFFQPT